VAVGAGLGGTVLIPPAANPIKTLLKATINLKQNGDFLSGFILSRKTQGKNVLAATSRKLIP
jgi:hypothetical protein